MTLITPQEAESLILADTRPLPAEAIALPDSLHRILRQDLHADRPFPPFDRVTMDGIAFRSTDLIPGAPLILQGIHPAGHPAPAPLRPGHCWQIMTGSVLPPDCDTIVPYEEVSLTETTAHLNARPNPGQFIHRRGSDAPTGHLLLESGTRLGPGHLGLLASIGAIRLQATRLPRIRIITTGDELIPADKTPLPHQLRQSNGLTLLSAVQQWGPAEVTWQHLPDDLPATTDGIAAALESSDLLLLSGGISKGRMDYVRPALESLIGPPLFHGVAQRPGKPLAFWENVLALPGNPNSTLTTFQRYAIPLLDRLTGAPDRPTLILPLARPITPHPALTLFLPATLDQNGHALALVPQNSGDFITPLQATGLLEIPPGHTTLTSARFISS